MPESERQRRRLIKEERGASQQSTVASPPVPPPRRQPAGRSSIAVFRIKEWTPFEIERVARQTLLQIMDQDERDIFKKFWYQEFMALHMTQEEIDKLGLN